MVNFWVLEEHEIIYEAPILSPMAEEGLLILRKETRRIKLLSDLPTYQVPTKLGLTRSLFVPDKPTSLAGSPIQNHKMWHPKFRFGQSGIKLHTQHISLRSRMSNVARWYQDIAEQKHQGQSKFIGSKLVWNWVFECFLHHDSITAAIQKHKQEAFTEKAYYRGLRTIKVFPTTTIQTA